jgi:Brp/Blh family beta-carotene 15,15'-monooxygenase
MIRTTPVVIARAAAWFAGLAVLLFASACPELASEPVVQWLPWALGLAVTGLPHGALDHRVGPELDGRTGRIASRRFLLAYLGASLAVLLMWRLWPAAALGGFLVVAAFHFGQGDVYWSRAFGLLALRPSWGYATLSLVVRGVLPVALPALAHPDEFGRLCMIMARHLAPDASVGPIPGNQAAAGLAVCWLLGVIQAVWALALSFGGGVEARHAAAEEAAEVALLLAMLTIGPPVLAVGVYFNTWHSPRHIARLMLVAGPTRPLLAAGRWAAAFGAFLRLGLPVTLVALAGTAALVAVAGRAAMSVENLGLIALVLVSALTLPHVLVVAWMDRRQGVWNMSRGVRS